jgi:serine/threonine protein kinase
VYEAVDLALQRTVALKKMRDEVAANPRERARFLKEARVVAALRHPHIVEIYSIQENSDGLFLVFERVPGETLHERLGQGALRPADALPLLRQVAAALDYAHSQGVVHQDLKPANIMVHGGAVKVMDFGIARRVQETLSTMSPEQEQGGAVGPAADLFALGVCAYEMLTGRLPFPQGGLAAKAQGLYLPASQDTPLPKGVDGELARALAAAPQGRHASATAFVDALARALA